MTTRLPRGIRNNNPGNIRLVSGMRWLGQVPAEKQTDPVFVQFEDIFYGVRAICRLLRTYRDRYGIDTVAGIIERWAPPGENDSRRYASYVATQVRAAPDAPIDLSDPHVVRDLVRAICVYECGHVVHRYVSEDMILRAACAAGLLDDEALGQTSVAQQLERERPVTRTRTIQGARTAAGATAAAAAVEALHGQLADAQGALALLVPYLGFARWALLALVLVGIGVTVWARLDDRRRGLR